MSVRNLTEKLQNFGENLPVVFDELEPCFVDEVSLAFYHPKLGDSYYRKELFDEMVRDAAAFDVEDLGWTTMSEKESMWIEDEYNKQVKKYYDEAKKLFC